MPGKRTFSSGCGCRVGGTLAGFRFYLTAYRAWAAWFPCTLSDNGKP